MGFFKDFDLKLSYVTFEIKTRVSWSSWSWHLLNTQNVGSSILPEIIFSTPMS
jgi:hypothetical protein